MNITILFDEGFPSRTKRWINFDSPKKLYDYLKSFDEISVFSEIDNQLLACKPAVLSCRAKIFYIETNLPSKKINFEYYFLRENKIHKVVRNREIDPHNYVFIFSHGLIILFIDQHRGSYWVKEKYSYVEEIIDEIVKSHLCSTH